MKRRGEKEYWKFLYWNEADKCKEYVIRQIYNLGEGCLVKPVQLHWASKNAWKDRISFKCLEIFWESRSKFLVLKKVRQIENALCYLEIILQIKYIKCSWFQGNG